MKIGGSVGKYWEEKVKPAAPTITDVMAPGAQNTIEAIQGKKSGKEAILDTAQDIYAPGSRRTAGSVSGSGGGSGGGGPQGLPPQNQWQQMHLEATNAYKGKDLGYNPYQTQAGPRMQGMNYDPYRQAAVNQASSQAGNQAVSQQAQLQQAGGLRGADRMKAFSDFNRSKIQGTLGANQQYNGLQSQNTMDVDRFNSERDFAANARNIAAGNDSRQFGAMANNRRDFNLYQDGLQQKNLGRQLEAAQIIGNAQMGSKYSPGFFEKLLDPVFKGFDAIGSAF